MFEDDVDAMEALMAGDTDAELILLDHINMPRMNGGEFVEAYRALPKAQQSAVVVVMLTSFPHPEDRQQAVALGLSEAFCQKPLTPEMAEQIVTMHFPDRV